MTPKDPMHPDDILARVYAGIIGKAVGVRLGAPVEPTIWTYERIRDTYGEIAGYLRDFRTFAADDDTNGPLYFTRVLRDHGLDFTAEEMGRTWLNYAAEEHGMFWWGGFGRSTEHTAWANLRAGIAAPRSGSIAQNGAAVAEQIGGQIFIDAFGWVHPGDPARAARAAATAASVAHDGEGLEGARFVAAAVAAAFAAKGIREAFDAAMATLDPASTYTAVARAVQAFHATRPDDWRACREMLGAGWGYDRYPGVCHIIPNAGVLVMALLYGGGDLCRTVEIATMAGWDTDCNAGNAGAVVGTLQGLDPSWDRYRRPVNDLLIASGVTGSLNIADIPSFARELTTLALRLAGREAPPDWAEDWERKGVRLDFALPGSTHGFRAAAANATQVTLRGSTPGPDGGALEILLDRMERDEPGRVFWKPFFRRADFEDERYRPMLTPVAADGQRVSFRLRLDPWEGDGHFRVAPYVRRSLSGRIEETGPWQVPPSDGWGGIAFDIPDGAGDPVDEIGLRLEYFGRLKFLGRLFLSDFRVGGPGRRLLDPRHLVEEWGTILQCTWNRGRWTLEGDAIQGHTATDADLWTGNLYATDQAVTARLTPLAGRSHLVAIRAQGTARFYAAGLQDGELVLLREDFGTEILARAPFEAPPGEEVEVTLEAVGDRLRAQAGDGPALEAACGRFRYGMAGLRMAGPGRMRVSRLEIRELA